MITFGVRAPQRQVKLTLPGTATVRAAKLELEAALGVPAAAQALCRAPSVRARAARCTARGRCAAGQGV